MEFSKDLVDFPPKFRDFRDFRRPFYKARIGELRGLLVDHGCAVLAFMSKTICTEFKYLGLIPKISNNPNKEVSRGEPPIKDSLMLNIPYSTNQTSSKRLPNVGCTTSPKSVGYRFWANLPKTGIRRILG